MQEIKRAGHGNEVFNIRRNLIKNVKLLLWTCSIRKEERKSAISKKTLFFILDFGSMYIHW
jgi:hypothetical protein